MVILNKACCHVQCVYAANNLIATMQERCAGADTISLVAQMLHRSKAHLQSMLLQNNAAVVEDFYVHLVLFFVIICFRIEGRPWLLFNLQKVIDKYYPNMCFSNNFASLLRP